MRVIGLGQNLYIKLYQTDVLKGVYKIKLLSLVGGLYVKSVQNGSL